MLSDENIKRILKDFGLTGIEAEVYLFLASRDPLKGTEIARQVKKDKAQVYRILKSLQAKGLLESTVEAPVRFTPVPFEKVVESTIRAKRDEAGRIESIKQELFDYWKNISRGRPESPLEKFLVIEGSSKIYPKIFEMINSTKRQFSIVSTIQGLLRADHYGLLDAAFEHPLKSKVTFRFLTELSVKNVNVMKSLLRRKRKAGVNFKGRNPNLGLLLSPQMVIRDQEEILLFITPTADASLAEQDEVCLWTNCKALLQMFVEVFEDLWRNSTEIRKRIAEIETGTPSLVTYVMSDPEIARKKYEETLKSAKKEIIIMTSSEGLIEASKNKPLLNEWTDRGVSVRIIATITRENLLAAHDLSSCCQVRHAPVGCPEITVIDGKHIFQFKTQPREGGKPRRAPYFEGTFYTNDLEYVKRTESMLNEIWRNAVGPSVITLDSIMKPSSPSVLLSENEYAFARDDSPYKKIAHGVEEIPDVLTEEEVLNKIINAKKYSPKNWPKEPIRYYGTSATAIIHPPDHLKLPDMIIWPLHYDKLSSFGAEDLLLVYLWLETPKGYGFVPATLVTDNPKSVNFWKTVFAGTPAGQNVQLARKGEFQVRAHANIVFAAWTVPILLLPPSYILEPACILFEGCSKIKSNILELDYPSGVKLVAEANGLDAFVTFFHPSSKYSGPGTDGLMGREVVVTIYPPKDLSKTSHQ